MAADTAITVDCRTVDGLIEERAFFGLTKLLPVIKLNAGISYWGWTTMPPSSSGIWMDWWLKHFLVSKMGDYNSIPELAELLEKELRKLVPPLDDKELEIRKGICSGGIHLTGFVEYDREKVPCFWHIHNGISQALHEKKIDPHIVNANFDCPPEKYLEHERKGEGYQTRNGDYEPYARFFDGHLSAYCKELYSEMGYVIPIPTTDFVADFLRTQIKFISGLYAVGGTVDRGSIKRLARGIGGNVTTLTITNDGIQSYKEF
jgi:hypothetical protein